MRTIECLFPLIRVSLFYCLQTNIGYISISHSLSHTHIHKHTPSHSHSHIHKQTLPPSLSLPSVVIVAAFRLSHWLKEYRRAIDFIWAILWQQTSLISCRQHRWWICSYNDILQEWGSIIIKFSIRIILIAFS